MLRNRPRRTTFPILALAVLLVSSQAAEAADHNDPNAVNSIFSDVPISPADLYDFFGFPGAEDGETVVLALTFASIPETGVLHPDFLYRVLASPGERVAPELAEDRSLETLLELEGNDLFNFDPARPAHGTTVKLELPPGPWTWEADGYRRDADGNFRFVYSGRDAQAGINVNAIVFELPLAFLTGTPSRHRVVNAWGESWVHRDSEHAAAIPDRTTAVGRWLGRLFGGGDEHERELARYKVVDTDGVPFLDAALSERRDDWQTGAENARLARRFVTRYGHLGWGFGPSITALGLGTCFDHGDAEVPVHRTYELATAAFPRVKDCLLQTVNMPDDSWKTGGVDVRLKRTVEIFIPNVCAIDMDTNGTWPYGRRLEDQVATRFLSLFLDMEAGCGGGPCHVESLADPALWEAAPIEPKTPPNPLENDKELLDRFPYLAEPW